MRNLRLLSSQLTRIQKTLNQSSKLSYSLHSSNNVNLTFSRNYNTPSQESTKQAPPEKVGAIVDELTGLTLLEVMDLTEVLRQKLDVKEMPIMAMMMPGMGFGGAMKGAGKGGAGGPGKGEEKKEEKLVFDVKLEAFDSAAKIKVIKEVRGFTDLGLKEAKDLVEKAPTVLKKGVTKEEAEKIIQKMKEVGAKVSME
ncbi:Ribosomal protein L7/L12 [Corchorus capsularis]|uniref:Ribosomal protein L7/L12 n=1 Tax=Corchorus capsularis TaxID=210143 RepID=A0A1R3GFV3_COCAP|nr:Ribosomal protein L7/L12 [Corchorus capsularis]